jgi:hypothetical protein
MPLNQKRVRTGRAKRVGGGGRRLARPSGKIYFDNLDNLAVASGNYREIIIIARFLTPHNLAIIYLLLSR